MAVLGQEAPGSLWEQKQGQTWKKPMMATSAAAMNSMVAGTSVSDTGFWEAAEPSREGREREAEGVGEEEF